MPPRDRSPATRARTLDLASQLLASDLTHEAVGPYLHRLLQPLGIDERVTKAALRLTGRARPKPLRPDLEPATAALRALEPVHRASYLVAAAERLQDGLDTQGVGYTGALAKEARYLAQHRAAVEGRDRAAAQVDDVASRHGPVLRWVARKDAHPGCRKMHGRLFRADDPPVVEGRPSFPGGVHPSCFCRAAPRLGEGDRAGVAVASLTGAVELAYNPAQLRDWRGRWIGKGYTPATPADRKRLAIPPAWTDVLVAPSESAGLLAVGIDAKGRQQPRYSAAHHEGQAVKKFARVRELHSRMPAIDARLSRDAKTDDAALAALLIRRMGLRPGSDTDTGADRKAHGATNLKAEHVQIDGDRVRLSFGGKSGKDLDLFADDRELADLLAGRMAEGGPDDRLLATDDRRLRKYMAGAAPGVKPKDFRTYLGTATAERLLARMPTPTSAKEYARQRKLLGAAVGKVLGNTGPVALGSYVDPAVFGPWDAALARARGTVE